MPLRHDPTILAFDTSAAHCAAALLRDGAICDEKLEHLSRGQAERLMAMLEEILAVQGIGWADLDALAVGIGPGNFTGTRISVSAARGLALALGIPAIGVSMFEVMAYQIKGNNDLISIEAPRGQAFVQPFRQGRPTAAPRLIDPADAPRDLQMSSGMSVIGWQADDIGRQYDAISLPKAPEQIAARIARIAEGRLVSEEEQPDRPAPLYVRPADAAPPRDAPPVILP